MADGNTVPGVVKPKDIVKSGIKERFAEMCRMGIKTVMATGDNKLTAAEAGVDDFLAETTPEEKFKLIRSYQAEGRLVAMTGDGTYEASALAQANVAVAMNSGTQEAKEAGNMVGLDFNPTKLLEIVETGKNPLDDARLAHHVLDCQRCGEIFRHHSSDFCHHLPATGRNGRDAAG